MFKLIFFRYSAGQVLDDQGERQKLYRHDRRRTNRCEFFFQISSWSGRCRTHILPIATARTYSIVTPVPSAIAATNTAVTWHVITDTNVVYRNDSNVRIASIICGNEHTCGRIYARFIQTRNSIVSILPLTRLSWQERRNYWSFLIVKYF